LDLMCASHPKSSILQRLPALCTAIVAVLKKFDKASTEEWMRSGFESYRPGAVRIAKWLRSKQTDMNCDIGDEQIGDAERRILKALRWTAPMSHFDGLLDAFWSRFNIFTEGQIEQQLNHLYAPTELSLPALMRWFLLGGATCAELAPRRVACGIFCVGLVRIGVLPSHSLQMHGHGLDQKPSFWEQLFQTPQFRAYPCRMSADHVQAFLVRLEAATGSSLDALREDCEAVATSFVKLSAELPRAARAEVDSGNSNVAKCSQPAVRIHTCV